MLDQVRICRRLALFTVCVNPHTYFHIQQNSIFVNPWENNQSTFRFPPQPINDQHPTDDPPYWLGGPLNDDDLDAGHHRQQLENENELHRETPRERMKSFQCQSMEPSTDAPQLLSYRRHSLAHHESVHRRQPLFSTSSGLPIPAGKRASFSAASFSSQVDPFGVWALPNKKAPLWDTPQPLSAPTTTETEYPSPSSAIAATATATSTATATTTTTTNNHSASTQQSLLQLARYTLADPYQYSPLLPPPVPQTGRRFSLVPTSSTSQDIGMYQHHSQMGTKRDLLSSVPEEPGSFVPYRRHSLAGPLLGVSQSLDEQRKQQRQLDKYLPDNLLSSGPILEVDPHKVVGMVAESWCMVEFKAGRSEIYCTFIPVEKDDWVIVEADRGRDLGKVVAKDLPFDQ
ncbi:hypothetical protein BX666DRAFT_2161791, partial [Dichotomocladium elegans]